MTILEKKERQDLALAQACDRLNEEADKTQGRVLLDMQKGAISNFTLDYLKEVLIKRGAANELAKFKGDWDALVPFLERQAISDIKFTTADSSEGDILRLNICKKILETISFIAPEEIESRSSFLFTILK
jgi:hypothetical protein